MATESNFNASTDYASVSGTVKDNFVALPNVPPSGLQAIGPRVTFHFVEGEWNYGNSYLYYDVVKTADDTAYIAIQNVPANTPINDTDYWFKWADPNSQMQELEDIVSSFNARINQATTAANNAQAGVTQEASTRAAADEQLSNQITLVGQSLGNIASSAPEFVDSTGDMTDHDKVYVLKSSGNIYYYDGSSFVDTGIQYGEDNAIRYVESAAEAPYNDFNTVPANTVIVSSVSSTVANRPVSASGILLTYGTPDGNFKSQWYCVTGAGDYYGNVYYRCYNGGASPSNWILVNSIDIDYQTYPNVITGTYPSTASPFNDCDTVPSNTVVIMSNDDNPQNRPVAASGILLSYGTTDNRFKTQWYCVTGVGNYYGNMYYRFYRTDTDPTPWELINDITIDYKTYPNVVTGFYTSNTFNDFNNVPNNTCVTVYATTNPSNGPINASGMLFTYGNEDNTSKAQIFLVTGNGDNYGDIFYRAYRSDIAPSPWRRVVTDKNDYGSVSLFESIGVIGDSFASGSIYNSSGTSIKQNYAVSWPQIMGRRYGIEAINYSVGGLTTETWLTNPTVGLPKLLSDPARNMYIIALGINDTAHVTLGTQADCTSSPDSNPNTFYGNLDRIVYNVKQHAPNAKIVLSTMANVSGVYPSYNEAIVYVAK